MMERKGNDKRKRQMRARENRMLIGGGRKRIKWKGSITQEKKKDSNFTWMKNKKENFEEEEKNKSWFIKQERENEIQ